MRFNIIAIIALLLLLGNVFAFEVKDVYMPKELNFYGEPKTLDIIIDNFSSQDKALKIEFFTTTKLIYYFTEKPSVAKAETRTKATLFLNPTSVLENSSYYATAIISLDNEKITKSIKLNFYPKQKTQEEKKESFTENTLNQLNEFQKNSVAFVVLTFNDPELGLINKWLLAIVVLLFVLLIIKIYDNKQKQKIEKEKNKWRQ